MPVDDKRETLWIPKCACPHIHARPQPDYYYQLGIGRIRGVLRRRTDRSTPDPLTDVTHVDVDVPDLSVT